MTKRISRRDFLLLVTGTAGALVVSCRPTGGKGGPPEDAGQVNYDAPDPNYGQVTYDKETVVTPTDEFFATSYGAGPRVKLEDWSLTIDGLVDTPLTLTYDDLLALEAVTDTRTLECIGNPVGGGQIGTATWTGVRLKPLLDRAGIQEEAIRARFYAADGYNTAVDVEWILQEDTLLAYAMNGSPLLDKHGYPVRIMMPGLYGQKMPKWLTRIEFINEQYLGYWEQRGWSDIAEVKTNSQIVMPPKLTTVRGEFAIQGWAYAGKRRITGVEVQIDDGEWIACELLEGPSPLAWTQWWTTWTPEHTGTFHVAVRATDEDGFTQDEGNRKVRSAYPEGTSAIHSVDYEAEPPPDA